MRHLRTLTIASAVLLLAYAGRRWLLTAEPSGDGTKSALSPSPGARQWAHASPVAAPLASFFGVVQTTAGAALPGASVCALGPEPARRCVSTDASGSYLLAGLDAGAQVIMASAPGYVSQSTTFAAGDHSAASEQLSWRLERGGARVGGSLVDTTGGVIVGAPVVAHSSEDERLVGVAVSDSAGQFELTARQGQRLGLQAVVDGYSTESLDVTAPASDLILRLTPASGMLGRVVAANTAAPLPDVSISATGTEALAAHPGSARSAPDGTFQLTALLPGRYQLLAVSPSWVSQPHWVSVGLGEVAGPVLIEAFPAVSLSGWIRVEGEACRGGYLELAGPRAVSHSAQLDGRLDVPGLLPGTYHATVGCADQGEAIAEELVVGRAALTRDWDLKRAERREPPVPADDCCLPTGTILVNVGPDPGLASALHVRVSTAGRSGVDLGVAAIPRGERLAFEGLGLGAYDVFSASSPQTRERAQLQAAGQVVEVRLVAPPLSEISGRVLDAQELPVADAWVSAAPIGAPLADSIAAGNTQQREGTPRVLTDAEGRFTLERLFPGSYRLSAQSSSGPAELDAVAAGQQDAVLRVAPHGSLSVELSAASGEFEPFEIVYRRLGNPDIQLGGGVGTWTLPWIAAGPYELVAISRSGFVTQAVSVLPGETLGLQLTVAAEGHAALPAWVKEHTRWGNLARATQQ